LNHLLHLHYDTTDDTRDDTGKQRRTGCQCNTQAQRQRNKKYNDTGWQIAFDSLKRLFDFIFRLFVKELL
jgi:hypothetical protein